MMSGTSVFYLRDQVHDRESAAQKTWTEVAWYAEAYNANLRGCIYISTYIHICVFVYMRLDIHFVELLLVLHLFSGSEQRRY